MGIEPFLVASSLSGVVAQRLVRLLCPDCRIPYAATAADARSVGLHAPPGTPFYGRAGARSA